MTFKEAQNIDTEYYVDLDDDSGLWCVFGNKSGFAYDSYASKDEADLRRNKWKQ